VTNSIIIVRANHFIIDAFMLPVDFFMDETGYKSYQIHLLPLW